MDKYFTNNQKINFVRNNPVIKFTNFTQFDELITQVEPQDASHHFGPIFSKIESAFYSDIDLQKGNTNKNHIHKIFDKFFTDIPNLYGTKIHEDIANATRVISLKLIVKMNVIKLNFIFDNELKNYAKYISIVVHAINTFAKSFPCDYNGLEINISLDKNSRDICIPKNITDINKKIAYLQKNSLAFNVSGVTYSTRKLINLTRIEEITKLLFHELVHFVGLDAVLDAVEFTNNWATTNDKYNLSETYTEFVSIIINTIYESIHLSKKTKRNTNEIFRELFEIEINYSVYLVANILKFFGYDQKTFGDFFNGSVKKISQPIMLFEYCFLRAILMLDLEKTMQIIPANFEFNEKQIRNLEKILRDDTKLVDALTRIPNFNFESISYLAVDLDWVLI